MEPTPLQSIRPPQDRDTVTLSGLLDSQGQPVTVEIQRLTPAQVAKIQGQLPGGVPSQGSREISPEQGVESALEWVVTGSVAPRFARISEPTEEALPVSWLGQDDLGALLQAIMKLSGVGSSFRSRPVEPEAAALGG